MRAAGPGGRGALGAVLTHWLPWLLWPVVRHLCGLCFPQWGRGWTLLRPLLKDGEECGGRLTGAGTARHPTTGALCGRRAVSGWCGPSGLRSPPACYGTAGEFPPTLASFTPAGARPGYGGEGDHETRSKAATFNSASRRLQLGHTLSCPSAARGSQEILAAGRGLRGVGWRPSSRAS